MEKNYSSNWKRPGMRSSDYTLSRDHNHDRRNFSSTENYSGRGPKNFQRTDERIKEDVCEMLMWDIDVDATDIEVTVDEGVVSLRGFVDSRHSKKMAERVIEDITGVKDVRNMLILKPNLDLSEDKIIARGDEGLYTQEIQKK